ncbi:unnamed protein product, partial [Polarella glacialis]
SFGFGGTNAHGVFWGESVDVNQDVERVWMRKLMMRPPPEVRPMGRNFDDWEADFPDTRALRKGAKFCISLSPDDMPGQAIRWEMVEEGLGAEAEDLEATFAISGNFNNWDADEAVPMADGEVPGVHVVSLQVPAGGVLEFQLLQGGDAKQVIGPASEHCTRKAEAILGPDADLSNKWVVHASEGKEVRIEFFSKSGRRSIMWLVERDPMETDLSGAGLADGNEE